jgi:hypothetical protein
VGHARLSRRRSDHRPPEQEGHMEGNFVILDIGGGRYVMYGHMKRGSIRVQAGTSFEKGRSSARLETPATPTSLTCICRCKTDQPSTSRGPASRPTRWSSRARRSPISDVAARLRQPRDRGHRLAPRPRRRQILYKERLLVDLSASARRLSA